MPTPSIGLTEPVSGTTPWDGIVNGNFTIIDNCFGGVQTVPAIAVTNLRPSTITQIGGLTTGGQGVPVILPVTFQKTETAADATLLSFTPPALAGTYIIAVNISVSAAAAAVLGWTATWRDSNSNAQTPTNLALTQVSTGGASGVAAPALTFTTSAASNYSGEVSIEIDNSATPIVLKFTLTSGTVTAKVTGIITRMI